MKLTRFRRKWETITIDEEEIRRRRENKKGNEWIRRGRLRDIRYKKGMGMTSWRKEYMDEMMERKKQKI